jgi:hypothetical protein
MSLPISDDEVLVIALKLIDNSHRGFTTGYAVRDYYWQTRTDFTTQRSATVSWTAALNRLERAGKLRRVELVAHYTNDPAFGFERPRGTA